MIIPCLENFIGLKNCGMALPESGLYLNSLPGITTELADKIANAEQVTFSGVFQDVLTTAHLRLKSDVLAWLQSVVKFNAVLYQTGKPRRLPQSESLAPAPEYRGVLISLPESKYVEVRIASVGFFSETALEGVEFIIADELSEGVIHREAIDVKVGFNLVPINYRGASDYEELRWFVGIDCSGLTLKKLAYDSDAMGWMPRNGHECADGMSIYPARYAAGAITRSAEQFSVWPQMEVLCSIDRFLCENRHSFTEALLYLLGWHLLEYKINNSIGSTRLNFFNTSNLEQTAITRDSYRRQYEKSIKTNLLTVPLDGDPICFTCDGALQVSVKGVIP